MDLMNGRSAESGQSCWSSDVRRAAQVPHRYEYGAEVFRMTELYAAVAAVGLACFRVVIERG